MSVQKHEVLCYLAYFLEYYLVFGGGGIITPALVVLTLNARNMFLNMSRPFLSVDLLPLYVAFYFDDHFC